MGEDKKDTPVEASAVDAELDVPDQLSSRAISKRATKRDNDKIKKNASGNPDPNYEVYCLDNSKKDICTFLLCFLCLYLLVIAIFVALLEFNWAVGDSVLWVYFGFFLFGLFCIGGLVITGTREKAEKARIAKKEAEEAGLV